MSKCVFLFLAVWTSFATCSQISSAPAFYPRLAIMNTNVTVAVVERPTSTVRQLVMFTQSRRTSWELTSVIVSVSPASPDVDIANGFLLQLRSGSMLCAYRHHNGNGTVRVYRVQVSRSNDDGATWAFAGSIVQGNTGVWEPFLYQLPGDNSNTVHAAYAAEITNGGEQDIVFQTSRDGGTTWGDVQCRVHTPGSRNGMPGLALLTDGSLFLVFEGFWGPAGWGHYTVNSMRSFDNGKTWGQPGIVHVPCVNFTFSNAGSPQVAQCRMSGAIAVVFMSNEKNASLSYAWPDGAHIGIVSTYLSKDNTSAPLVFPATAGTVPTPTTIYWPSLFCDESLGQRIAYQSSSGASELIKKK